MLENLKIARFRFEMVAQEEAVLPKFKGSTLRGGFGYVFKSIACSQEQSGGKSCQQMCSKGNNACAYGYLFETCAPANFRGLSAQAEAPGPFVIEPPDDDRTNFKPGDKLCFDLVLYGRGIEYLPAFIVAFDQLGRTGMGKNGGRFKLERVSSLSCESVPASSSNPFIMSSNNGSPTRNVIYDKGRAVASGITTEDLQFDYQHVANAANHNLQIALVRRMARLDTASFFAAASNSHPATVTPLQLEVRFQTPLRQKYDHDWLQEPHFAPLMTGILRRAILLNSVHCGGDWENEWKAAQPLLEMSQSVQMVTNKTRWVDWDRYSTRQQQKMNLGGLVGSAIYQFPNTQTALQLLPLLELARYIHVGKATVFGHGKLATYLLASASTAAAATPKSDSFTKVVAKTA